jgi:hypothetical protein
VEQNDIPAWVFAVAAGFAVLVVLVVLAARRGMRLERERQQRLAAWAQHHEWTYAQRPRGEWPWMRRLPGSTGRRVSLVLSGTFEGYPVTVAEYSYTTSSSGTDASGNSTSSSTTHRLTVAVVRLPEAYPPVEVASRSAASRLARSLFGEGQVSTGDREFDRRLRIKSPDPATARALVGPALISAHLAERVPAWSLDGDELVTYRQGLLPEPDDVSPLVAPLVEVARLLHR